jgi:hypothetical protein
MEDKDLHQLFYIASLIRRHRTATLTAEEQATLSTWLAAGEENRQLFRELTDEHFVEDTRQELAATDLQASFERVYTAIGLRKQPEATAAGILWLRSWKWAAAVLVLMAITTAAFLITKKNKPPVAAATLQPHDVAPGTHKATLTLANGSSIILDNTPDGVVASQGATVIRKTGNGQLLYDASQTGRNNNITYNTITTPNGGEFQVVLPDGSKVWLNAASSIRFPAAFSGNSRQVEITGEAYLEITKNATAPFSVVSGKHTVTVLGTSFNIHAYTGEENIVTTLLQGSIRVTEGAYSKVLQPGQQSSAGGAAGIQLIDNADTEAALAWRNGQFVFNDADLKTVVSQLERWYDVSIDYSGMSGYRFNGEISRNVSLSKVLKMMELTSNIHYTINGKNIHMTR